MQVTLQVSLYSRGLHLMLLHNYAVFRLLLDVDCAVELARAKEEAQATYAKELAKFQAGTRETAPRPPSGTVGVNIKICKDRYRGIASMLSLVVVSHL